MKLNLLTFNVRGLNEDAAMDSLKVYIQDFRPKLDILAIQEHKLRGDALQRLGTWLWRSATFWGLEASLGYGHSQGDQGASCGRVATLVAPQWARLISQSGTLLNNRVHWFVLSRLPGSDDVMSKLLTFMHQIPRPRGTNYGPQ
jgi:hypothetical protein